jgi:cytochrome c
LDSFEFNKTLSALLVALLIGMISAKVADALVAPEKITKSVYIVQGMDEVASAGGEEGPKGPEPIEPLLATADIERGKVVAKKCLQCHTFDKGEANKIGPNLYGIVGEKVADVAGYTFSAAMSSIGGEWTVQRLNDYLFKPAKYVKGTKMSFAGLTNGQERALSDSPKPLPTAAEASASTAAK